MRMETGIFVLLILISVIASPAVGSIQFNDKFNNNCEFFEQSKCNVEIGKQLQTKAFILGMIQDHASNCYVIQLRNNNLGFNQHFSDVPTMEVNLHNYSSSTMFDHFNTMERRTLIRYQEQCIIFYVIFHKDEQHSVNHLRRLSRVFQHPKLHAQAHQSYIFINDFENEAANHDTAKDILLHPSLKNYEHKAWIEVTVREYGTPGKEQLGKSTTHFQINNFCYFCQQGKPGIDANPKFFTDSKRLKSLTDIFPEVTSNLYGKAMKVTAAMALPFVGIVGSPLGKFRIEGMQGTILTALAQTLNFTVILENTSKGLTGSKLPNGTWTGTIGEVYYGRADIGLNAATSYDRHEVVDFTVSAFYGFLVLVSTKPSPFFEWQAIVYPFEILSWLGICASTSLTVFAFRFFLNHGDSMWTKSSTGEVTRKPKVSYLRVSYITIGTLLEQGIPFNYRTTPSRIFAFFWLMFALVTTCAYKSKLFSYLTFPIIKTPPSSFYELATSDYSWGIKSLGGVALLFITKSPVAYIRRVGEKMEISMDKYSCMDKTFSPKFTCIIYRAYYDYMSAVRYWKIANKFYVSDYVTPPVGSSWVLPKYSPLLHPLDKLTFTQFEMGLAGIYLEHYIKHMALKSRALAQASKDVKDIFETNAKFKQKTILEKPLEFANVYASFLILYFGVGMSAAVLATEFFRDRNKATTRKKAKQAAQNIQRRLRLNGILHIMRPQPARKRVRFNSQLQIL